MQKTMNYLSICSGIEAATEGWHSLGWKPVAFSEIEKFPCSVLAHYYPDVPNWGDMTKFKEWPDAAVDVLVGGTPCQSFSVAGLRKGLADPRGNLMLTYLAIAAKYSPEWLVWENVPGVLSSNGGRDFASLLRGMAELGYGFAYRILDAQYFGVAQRRRRVFVVGYLGDWRRAAAVLFERHSLQGHPAPRRETRQGASGAVADCLTKCRAGSPDEVRGTANMICMSSGQANAEVSRDVGTTLTTLTTPHEAPIIAHALRGEGFDASEDGTGRGTPLVPVAFAHQASGAQTTLGYDQKRGTAPTLSKCQTLAVAIGLDEEQNAAENLMGTLKARTEGGGFEGSVMTPAMQVRRLTPVECSRLQGFPDDYLELAYANADEVHAAQVLHELWREARTPVIEKQGWRTGIVAALLTPEILLSGVHGGWLSWEMATRCAAARGALSGEEHNHEGFVRALRQAGTAGRSPFGRESFEQFARELGSDMSILPLEGASARKVLRSSELWSQAQARWPLRYAFAKGKTGKAALMTPDGPRYKALGNSMAVPVMAWIGKRIQQVEEITCTTKQKYHSA